MIIELKPDQLASARESYLNILALFLGEEKIDSRYIRCLVKWAIQLKLDPDDLMSASKDISTISFSIPGKIERLESIYHLVYMIYLDRVVEDIELEVANIYAKALGFDPIIVAELFKDIVTAKDDEETPRDVRQEVIDFLKLHEDEA